MYKKIFFFSILSISLFAQNTNDDYNQGLSCFMEGDYVCARFHFLNLVRDAKSYNHLNQELAHYYYYLSSLRLYHPESEILFEKFLQRFPFSAKKNDAIYFMADYFFEKKKYTEVVDLLSQVNLYKLDKSKKSTAFFYLGYSAYVLNQYDLAKSSLYELTSVFDNPFREDAVFFNAQILFQEGRFVDALSDFESLKKSAKYQKKIPYYISQILFQLNQYEQLVNYLESIVDLHNYDNYQDLVLLQAKSFYHINKYAQAVVYFEEYKTFSTSLTKEQLYQIGYSYYQKELYGFAIDHLNKISLFETDTITQFAFYYLGDSYRKINNKTEAMNAFRSASLLELDLQIQHDAFYQFALLCYDQGNVLCDPLQNLSDFIDKYPNSKHVDQIYTCLANIYLNSHNYNDAISILEKSTFSDSNVEKQYQKICFFRGVQLYNDQMYKDAIIYFDKAINVNNDSYIINESYFWKAEAYYNLDAFSKALLAYKKINPSTFLYKQSLYSQGYCYLKQKNFYNSIDAFTQAEKHTSASDILHDIYIRLGDNYFSLSKYQSAADFFHKGVVIGGFQADYAAYKKSTAYVLLADYDNAIASFNDLMSSFPNSNYLDDAIFDLGNVYILNQKYDLAIQSFTKIINQFPNSLFFSHCKLKIGLVHYIKNEDKQAITALKNILDQFPNTNTSEQALNIIKNIYNELGQSDKFLELIKTVDHDFTKSELDSSTYYSAELQYMQTNYKTAIQSLNSYLSYYPEGLFIIEANYLLYKSYEYLGDLDKALEYLNNLIDDKENKYTIEVVEGLAEISFKLEKYLSSERYFEQLLNIADAHNVKQKAVLGLIESKFNLYNYAEVINSVNELIQDGFFSGQENLRIHYMYAYSLYKNNQIQQSLEEFDWLIKHSDGVLKAESFYFKSLILYNSESYIKSKEVIFQLINELPIYNHWIDKGLLLLAKNYIVEEDMFQAHHVLLELQGKTDDQTILEEINKLLNNNFNTMNSDSIIKN